jgi:hypothetical protein
VKKEPNQKPKPPNQKSQGEKEERKGRKKEIRLLWPEKYSSSFFTAKFGFVFGEVPSFASHFFVEANRKPNSRISKFGLIEKQWTPQRR